MSEAQEQPKRPPKTALVFATVFVLGAVTLGVLQSGFDLGDWYQAITYVLLYEAWNIAPLVLLAAWLYSGGARRKASTRLLIATFAVALALLVFHGRLSGSRDESIYARVSFMIRFENLDRFAIDSTLLLVSPIRRPWRWLKWVCLASLSLLMLCAILVELRTGGLQWLSPSIFMLVSLVVELIAIISAILAAWAIAFRPALFHATPADSSHEIDLTCPRCQSPVRVRTPDGQCANCSLKFHLAIEEGTCRSCGYLLRGLRGDKCPECGTSLVAKKEASPTSAA